VPHVQNIVHFLYPTRFLGLLKSWRNTYNELGELIDKKLHSEDNGSSFAQSVDYKYNIRGWLTRLNDAQLTDGERDYFGMELGYNEDIGLNVPTADLQFNGNISAVEWSEDLSGNTLGYGYQYDPLNRISKAQSYYAASNAFNLDTIDYDLNGNIQSLTRMNETGTAMDVLDYNYGANTSNQLMAVTDNASITDEGFVDGNTSGDDYDYDENGNMTQDLNKGIDSISYNYLNLPEVVYKGSDSIRYIYDAAGIKLAQLVYDNTNSLTKRTDYVGEFIYENDTLQLIQHEEGRIIPGPVPGSSEWEYQYYLKDHLGNTRVTFTTKPKTIGFNGTFETEAASEEESTFENIPETRVTFNSADANSDGGNEVVQVNNAQPMGAGISLPVGVGDTLNMEVYAYYEGGSGYSTEVGLTEFIGAVAGGFGGINGGTEAQQATYDAFNNAISGIGFTGTSDDLVPAAYLNYILFDENMQYYQHGHAQISNAANASHEKISLNDIEIPKAGFAFIYLSNESNSANPVYFDDMEVIIEEHPVIQKDDYYPYGLVFNNGYQRVTAKKNDFLYNGKELENELDVGWYAYGQRNYDASLGRFFNNDRFAEKYHSMTPYQYGANNPVLFVDINGDSLDVSFFDRDGNRLKSVPKAIQNMFNSEYGISVGYNAKTSMLYYEGEVETDNEVSESAKETIVSALTDKAGGKGAAYKYGEIIFGYGQNFGSKHPPLQVNGGASNKSIAWIDMKDFRRDGSLNIFNYSDLDASGTSRRVLNLGRVFEHEWIGHVLNQSGDGLFQNTRPGGAVNAVNKFRSEMGLPQRLNYAGKFGMFFSHDTSRANFRRMRKAAKQGNTVSRIK